MRDWLVVLRFRMVLACASFLRPSISSRHRVDLRTSRDHIRAIPEAPPFDGTDSGEKGQTWHTPAGVQHSASDRQPLSAKPVRSPVLPCAPLPLTLAPAESECRKHRQGVLVSCRSSRHFEIAAPLAPQLPRPPCTSLRRHGPGRQPWAVVFHAMTDLA